MLTPHKHLKLNTSLLSLSALALEYLHKYRSVPYHQLYAHLERRIRMRDERDADDVRLMFGPTVSFLFLLGKVQYHSQNDLFEYVEMAKAKRK
jgi:hypothetical protein